MVDAAALMLLIIAGYVLAGEQAPWILQWGCYFTFVSSLAYLIWRLLW